MFDILSIVPGNKKQSASGWYTCNGICCSHRGHRPDTRHRCGIRLESNNWVIHCFNCNFSCSFILGKSISARTRQFLTWCGVDNEQIQRWNIESLQKKDLLDFTTRKTVNLKFKTKVIPGEELNSSNKDHKPFAEYLIKRKVPLNALPFHVSPNDTGRNANRIIIPYIFKGKVVGHTSRYLDNKTPRYINEQQPGYVFNIDAQRPDWQVCIVTEGIFDALSIDGVALLHNDISEDQSILLASLNKKIIFVPDRDPSGLKLTDRALELGYSVSIPNWDKSVKDVNDAVVKYGKLPTLLSILQFATNSKIKIEMRKKKIE